MLSLSPRLVMRLEPASCESVFPEVDRLLAQSEHQKALEFIARRKNMDRYRNMVDFLFNEIFIEWRPRCFAYYKGRGKQLKDEADPAQIALWEPVLVQAIKLAHQKMEAKQRASDWSQFILEVRYPKTF